MGLMSLPRRISQQGLIVGLAVTVFIVVSICPDLYADCLSRGHQTCQDSTCVFRTLGHVFAVLIIHTWLVWTRPLNVSHAYPLRLFRPPRPRLLP